jgi:hypothetical protein
MGKVVSLKRRKRTRMPGRRAFFDRAWLLKRAEEKPVRWFYQFDAWHQPGGDGLAESDPAGDVSYAGFSPDLRHTESAVRVQILEGVSHKDALRMLRKLLKWAEECDWTLEG